MKYQNIHQGIFVARPNRFIAHVQLGEELHICHVKNTGRCKELLIPGCTVYLEESSNPNRKTKYDLVGVEKGNLLINMDSQAPNQVVKEWLEAGGIFPYPTKIQGEKQHGNSRVDFYLEEGDRKAFVEVKGVTLEVDGVASFPDAPTERGIKHIYHMMDAMKEGYEAYLVFVIQMKGIKYLVPNDTTHPAFGQALREAAKEGLNILAYDCIISKDTMVIDQKIEVRI